MNSLSLSIAKFNDYLKTQCKENEVYCSRM